MLNFGQDIGWGSPTKYDSYGRYIWEIKACYLVMAPLSPCPPGAYLTSQVGLKFIYNAKFWAGHWVGVTNKNRIAMTVTSGL